MSIYICAICERARVKQHARYVRRVAIKTHLIVLMQQLLLSCPKRLKVIQEPWFVVNPVTLFIWYWRKWIIFQKRQFAWIFLCYTTVFDYYCQTGTARCHRISFENPNWRSKHPIKKLEFRLWHKCMRLRKIKLPYFFPIDCPRFAAILKIINEF